MFNIKPKYAALRNIYIGFSIASTLLGFGVAIVSLVFGMNPIFSIIGLKLCMLILGIILILFSALNAAIMWIIYGQSKKCLILLSIFEFLIMSVSMISFMTILINVEKNITDFQDACVDKKGTTIFAQFHSTMPDYNTFGVQAVCPILHSLTSTQLTAIYSTYSINILSSMNGYISVPSNANDKCHALIYASKVYNYQIAQYYEQIEIKNNCSGICTNAPIYYFSNTLTGAPSGKCDEYIIADIRRANIVAFSHILLTLLFIVLISIVIFFMKHIDETSHNHTVPIDSITIQPTTEIIANANINLDIST